MMVIGGNAANYVTEGFMLMTARLALTLFVFDALTNL
jgi:hypothetical protein